VTSHSQEGST